MSLSTQEIDFLRDLVAEQSGNVVAPRQAYLLEQRLVPVAEKCGVSDVSALVNKVKSSSNPKISSQIAEAVTVNETSFFRDMHLFEAMRKTIIPKLIDSNQASRRIRIWSAACSSGQEIYSLAMVIREHFPELATWNVQILATDICEEMLAKSRSGQYSQLEVNRGLPVKKLIQFFDRQGSNWTAKPELRSLMEHRKFNLSKPWPYVGEFDMVLMRNVLIYFDMNSKQEIITRARRVLRSEGYFFVGSSETTIGLNIPFERELINDTVCYRPL